MTTRIMSKKTFASWCLMGTLLIAVWLLVSATQAKAETMKYNWKYNCTSQTTKLEYVVLPDVEGHVVGVFERRGVDIFETEVAAIVERGTFDKIKNVRTTFQGYA